MVLFGNINRKKEIKIKISKIKISNLFGIKEQNLDGKSIEITGSNGQGKTSILDAIRYALTNSSERDYIVKKEKVKEKY